MVDVLPVAFSAAILSFLSSLAGLWLAIRRSTWGDSEAAELARLRREHERAERRRLAEIKRVAKQLRPQIIQALARQGFSYIYERQGAVSRMSTPGIKTILYTKDAIYYRIDRLPFRKTYTDLMQPEVAQNVSLAIGRECVWQATTAVGVWLQVGLKSGVSAIPKFFPWHSKENPQNAIELLPKSKTWTVPIGMTVNRRFVYEDARDFPHLLVAGATGGGKSVFMNQLLTTLISRNSPARLQLVLIDLKGGLEFWPYKELPHLRRPVVIDAAEVPAALDDIMREKERRFTMLRQAGLKDVSAWNNVKAHKLPYVFVFFDEIANLMLNKKIKVQVDALIQDLAAQGRALGLHLILCTQVPNRDVLSTIIRGNIPTRVCFNTDHTGSMIVLGNQRAAEIPAGGRMIYKRASTQIECQAPMITEQQISTALAENLPQDGQNEITAMDLFRAAVFAFGGRFTIRAIYQAFEGAIGETFVRRVANDYEYSFTERGPVIDIDGDRFVLGRVKMPGGRGRFLVPVVDRLPETQAELDKMAAPAVAAMLGIDEEE